MGLDHELVDFGIADAVQLGLVHSLNQPSGNVTGVTFLTTELMAKRLELLRELIPQATTVAYLADQRSSEEMLRDTLAAAGAVGGGRARAGPCCRGRPQRSRLRTGLLHFCGTPSRGARCRSQSAV